jgi:hypothetical protein
MIPYAFSALTMKSVGIAAQKMVNFILILLIFYLYSNKIKNFGG